MTARPKNLSDSAELDDFVQSSPICIVYFSAPGCGVCEVLKPKLMHMLEAEFPLIARAEVDCAESRALAAAQSVFSIPSVIVFTQGRESLRMSRSFGLAELAEQLTRPYSVLYG